MAEENTVFKQDVKTKGYWNYSELYKFCFNWLKDEDYKIAEKKYVEKVSGFGKEIEIEWEAKKKITDYLQNVIAIKWHILGLKDAEVERDGKKESTNKGEVKITAEAKLVRDYEERWEDHPLWKTMRGIYDKYVIRTTIDEYEDKLGGNAEAFIEQVKAFLTLEGKK